MGFSSGVWIRRDPVADPPLGAPGSRHARATGVAWAASTLRAAHAQLAQARVVPQG